MIKPYLMLQVVLAEALYQMGQVAVQGAGVAGRLPLQRGPRRGAARRKRPQLWLKWRSRSSRPTTWTQVGVGMLDPLSSSTQGCWPSSGRGLAVEAPQTEGHQRTPLPLRLA